MPPTTVLPGTPVTPADPSISATAMTHGSQRPRDPRKFKESSELNNSSDPKDPIKFRESSELDDPSDPCDCR